MPFFVICFEYILLPPHLNDKLQNDLEIALVPTGTSLSTITKRQYYDHVARQNLS